MKLQYESLCNQRNDWECAGVALPSYDWATMREKTIRNPRWIHFGAGNIFRGFIAGLQQHLLNSGESDIGIIAAETFDFDIIDQIYKPHDSMTVMVSLMPDGSMQKELISSIACGLRASRAYPEDYDTLTDIFRDSGLQMVSFTVTEKGYALKNMSGEYLPVVLKDMENGPENCNHAMSIITSLLWERFQVGGAPLAVVSMDNCSHNGEKLRASVILLAQMWLENGFVSQEYLTWLKDETKVSFPWTMIDKITPRPSPVVEQALAAAGLEEMTPVITSKNTYIAPFVNAESPQYLVIEDRFPNGRPALEKAGVYFTERDTVNKVERMKVTTCLNPLHTALAVYGCLLGYQLIADEMKDPQLYELVRRIGYQEGLPVVTNPGILDPKTFIDEVITQRLPNPFMPDAPQRIAADTSLKIPIRFGETIKAYGERAAELTYIPLAIAGWLRYLFAVNDKGEPMTCSSDPLLATLQEKISNVKFGEPSTCDDKINSILSNAQLFGVDLTSVGLGDKIKKMLKKMLAGPGAVRNTLCEYLSETNQSM